MPGPEDLFDEGTPDAQVAMCIRAKVKISRVLFASIISPKLRGIEHC